MDSHIITKLNEQHDNSLNQRESNLLIRIDERTKILVEEIGSIKIKLENNYVTQHEHEQCVKQIQEIKETMVTQEQFYPVRTLCYGFVGIILIAVVGALIALVLK